MLSFFHCILIFIVHSSANQIIMPPTEVVGLYILKNPLIPDSHSTQLSQSDHHTTDQDGGVSYISKFFSLHPGSCSTQLSQSDHHTTDQDSGALHWFFYDFLVYPGSRSTQLSQSDHHATDGGSGALRRGFFSDSWFS